MIVPWFLCFLISASDGLLTPVRTKRFLLDEPNYQPVNITQATYKAAVYNYRSYRVYPSASTRAQALKAVSKNLAKYEIKATFAEQQDVDILVFPEYGLFLDQFSRQSIKPYLETIPDPKEVTWNPCTHPKLYNRTEILHGLSCMARNHSLYIVANMGDIQPCVSSGSDCPDDGVYHYNTDVVFDPTGNLIARYHKKNLYFEDAYYDSAPVELITFDTSFGRFAVFTCFDSLYKDPAVSVIEKYNVDSVAFPTLWSDTPPFLKGFQWQAAFAAGMRVNLLASNHYSAGGSGIYTPTGAAAYVSNNQPDQLLIATIPSRPLTFPNLMETPISENLSSDKDVFHNFLFRDVANFVTLKGRNGTATVCNGTLCCQAEFSRTEESANLFALVAFSGIHTYIARGGFQVCALTKCAENTTAGCERLNYLSDTHFTRLVMKGSFSTKYVYPEIMVRKDDQYLLPGNVWTFSNNVLRSNNGFTDPLIFAALFGRDYSKDFE